MTFTFEYIENQLSEILGLGYKIIPCEKYIEYKKKNSQFKVLVNRVDIDYSIKKAKRLAEIFTRLKIGATFFLRLHAPEYNPFSFENYLIIKTIIESNFEIGYHSEIVDQATIWNENPVDCLIRDLKMIQDVFGKKVKGIASHGGMTGLNNLDFWKNHKVTDFGLLYEAYDHEPDFNLFQESLYVSDSEWTQWKCYQNGLLVKNDRRSLLEHAREGHKILYSLIHSDTFYERHFYE